MSHPRTTIDQDAPTWQVIAAGTLALAIAMGIGRFAFTPILPLMLRDGTLEAGSGPTWAAANYAGYLLGALTVQYIASWPDKGVRLALGGIAVTTLAIPFAASLDWSSFGPLLRGASGVFSAWVLVGTSAWCLTELARRGEAAAGAWVYTGVGTGIALTGVLTWLGGSEASDHLWLILGVIASLGLVPVAYVMGRERGGPRKSRVTAGRAWLREPSLILAYGAFGFGYIVPATFLPVMARRQVDDPSIFGLTWPLFGLAAALSVAAAARWLPGRPRRRVWALAQTAMAIGTALPILTPSIWGLAASAVFVGGSFMIATMAGLQLAQELNPENPAPLQSAMTVAFAVGQILGPLLVHALESRPAGWDPLSVSHACATIILAVTVLWLWAGPRGLHCLRSKRHEPILFK